MTKRILIAVASVCAFTFGAQANDNNPQVNAQANDPKMQEMMMKFQAAATPGPNHKMLAEKVGTWNYVSKIWESPKAKPQETKGTSVFSSILGGRWLQQNFTGEAMGQKFEGMGLVGYDNVKEKFQSVWFDTMSTSMMHGEGSYDGKKKVLKETGTVSCAMTESKTQEFRNEWQMPSKNKMIFSMFGKGPTEGPEFKMMEVTYTR